MQRQALADLGEGQIAVAVVGHHLNEHGVCLTRTVHLVVPAVATSALFTVPKRL